MKKTFVMYAVAVVITSMLVAGCETTKGVGRDVESAGESIQRTAHDVQD